MAASTTRSSPGSWITSASHRMTIGELFPFCLDTVPMTGSTALGVQLSKTDAAAWMARLTASSRDGTEPGATTCRVTSGRYISGVSWFVLAPPGSHARYLPN